MSTKRDPTGFSQIYADALRARLQDDPPGGAESALQMMGSSRGRLAAPQVLALAKTHERVLVLELLPECPAGRRAALLKRAGEFFAATVCGTDPSGAVSREEARIAKAIAAMSRRNIELAASNLNLVAEKKRRQDLEKALKNSERHHAKSLAQSDTLKQQLRRLSRQVLSVQEEERKRISRELHDVVAQTLTGINIRLAALKKQAASHSKNFDRQIALTQRLVAKSADIVHRFARELRPPALDDLGLVAALHSYIKLFTLRTGVRVHLTAFAGTERLATPLRTVLYRVAQEALTNVARHARASIVELNIMRDAEGILMRVADNGVSFVVASVLNGRGRKCLGLIGMRERVEMIGGAFHIESSPGIGTIVEASIPLRKAATRAKRKNGGPIP